MTAGTFQSQNSYWDYGFDLNDSGDSLGNGFDSYQQTSYENDSFATTYQQPAGPALSGVIGKPEYYLARKDDFEQRNIGNDTSPPSYYDWGHENAVKFNDLKPSLSKSGQAWVDRTMVNLQRRMENQIAAHPRIEYHDAAFTKMAVETHVPAYWNSGFHEISPMDKIKVLLTVGIKEIVLDKDVRGQAKDLAILDGSAYIKDSLFLTGFR